MSASPSCRLVRGGSFVGRTQIRALAWLAFAVAAVAPGSGQARPEFPPDITRHLSATVEPACSLCHLEAKTGGITVVTPFALALRAHGFTDSTTTLNAALDAMQKDGTDTDGDGVSDVDELRAGTDPNSPAPGATTADPRYGCGVAGQQTPATWPRTLALTIVAVVLRRRRRAMRARPGDVPVNEAEARPSSACPRGRP